MSAILTACVVNLTTHANGVYLMRVPYGNICTGPPHPSSISLIRRYSLVQPFGNLAPSLTLTQSVSQSRYPYRWRRQVIRIIRSFVACIRNTFCACKYFSSYYSASLSLSLSLSLSFSVSHWLQHSANQYFHSTF